MDKEVGHTVANIIPVMHVFFLQEQHHCKCVHYRVTPTFVKETTRFVHVIEEGLVFFTSEE
jgi:hypothetical protein